MKSYQEYASKVTDAPLPFADYLALFTAGTCIGRQRFFWLGNRKLYCNFFLIIIAPSSLYRKSTALSISRDAVYSVDPTKVFPSDFSQEKMQEILKETPIGAFYWYEWKTLMGMLSKEYMSGAKSFLTELWDCYSIPVARKGISFTVENPCCSIAAATTSDWLLENIKTGDIEGGFLARFLFVYSKEKLRDDPLPPEPDQMLSAVMKNDLQALANLPEEKMTLSPEAENEYKLWYFKFSVKFEKLQKSYSTLFGRLRQYCLKIAMVVETCETQGAVISLKSMQRAIHYTDWLQHSLTELCHGELSFNLNQKWEKNIVRLLKDKGGKMSRSNLMNHSNLSKKQFDETVSTLLDKELIKTGYEKHENAPKQTQIFELQDLTSK